MPYAKVSDGDRGFAGPAPSSWVAANAAYKQYGRLDQDGDRGQGLRAIVAHDTHEREDTKVEGKPGGKMTIWVEDNTWMIPFPEDEKT